MGDARLAAADVDGEIELELRLHVDLLAGGHHLDDRRSAVDAFVGESLGQRLVGLDLLHRFVGLGEAVLHHLQAAFSAGRLGRIEPGRSLDVFYDPANPERVEPA